MKKNVLKKLICTALTAVCVITSVVPTFAEDVITTTEAATTKSVTSVYKYHLESYDKNYDRYTFFGREPEEIIRSRGNTLVITRNDGSEEVREGNPLQLLKEYYSEFDIVKDNEELSFSGGLVGNLGYDFVRYAEVLPDDNPDEIGIETIQMMLMTKFIIRTLPE